MKILLTGAAGFIGFHTSLFLLKKNIHVFGVDNINDYYDVELKKRRLEILNSYENFHSHLLTLTFVIFVMKIIISIAGAMAAISACNATTITK